MKRLLSGMLMLAALAAGPVAAETMYVTDQLRLGVFAGEGATGERLKLLSSGDRLQVLERRPNFALVTTDDGVTGWVKSAFLVSDKPAVLIVAEIDAERQAAEQRIEALRAEYADADAVHNRLREGLETANATINSLETELAGYRAARGNVLRRLGNDLELLGLFAVAVIVMFVLGQWLGRRHHERRLRQRFAGLSLGD
jgi:hypothetical protein